MQQLDLTALAAERARLRATYVRPDAERSAKRDMSSTC